MPEITIRVGRELFRFKNFRDWDERIDGRGMHDPSPRALTIHVDSKGRLCTTADHMIRASDDDAFPVVCYAIEEGPLGGRP